METLISKRIKSFQKYYNSLPELQDLYCKISYDYGFLSDEMINSLANSQVKKRELKELNLKTMAEFNREYELSNEYLIIKSCKYQLKGMERLLSGLKVRIEVLSAELKNS